MMFGGLHPLTKDQKHHTFKIPYCTSYLLSFLTEFMTSSRVETFALIWSGDPGPEMFNVRWSISTSYVQSRPAVKNCQSPPPHLVHGRTLYFLPIISRMSNLRPHTTHGPSPGKGSFSSDSAAQRLPSKTK